MSVYMRYADGRTDMMIPEEFSPFRSPKGLSGIHNREKKASDGNVDTGAASSSSRAADENDFPSPRGAGEENDQKGQSSEEKQSVVKESSFLGNNHNHSHNHSHSHRHTIANNAIKQ